MDVTKFVGSPVSTRLSISISRDDVNQKEGGAWQRLPLGQKRKLSFKSEKIS